ncbi:hypothetical protein PR002_g9965 [Phytophthora rubi]|uniref:Uncharacterized protein n=1 Tax=Phytophthora rubi TaxID=129364 RepID=A0A6A3MCU0_9STRA|nr:hypothetical protein PR002_g9965 [Phytophthora rubi]
MVTAQARIQPVIALHAVGAAVRPPRSFESHPSKTQPVPKSGTLQPVLKYAKQPVLKLVTPLVPKSETPFVPKSETLQPVLKYDTLQPVLKTRSSQCSS